MPRLRAETPLCMRSPSPPLKALASQADEVGHYGVQARRRDVRRPEGVATNKERLRYVIDFVHVKWDTLAMMSSQRIIES